MRNAVELFDEDAQDADLGLIDDRPFPAAEWPLVGGATQSFNGKELATVVDKVPGRLLEPPLVELG